MAHTAATNNAAKLISIDFQVFGKVQGVFFRKYTQQEAQKLGLVGWVRNESDGSVAGQMQGTEDKVKKLKEWLSKTGSPKSVIERAEFKNEKTLKYLEFGAFDVSKFKH